MTLETEKIIDFAKKNAKISSLDVAGMFSISRQSAQKKLGALVKEGILMKIGKTRASTYILPESLGEDQKDLKLKLTNNDLKEHEVLEDVFFRFAPLRSMRENVQSIFRYAFSEMLNNAIEHSQSDRIEVRVGLREGLILFEIRDFGIGVFRNVMQKFNLESITDAIGELMKGKTTTAPKAHSGEGIFFSSKIADTFSLESFGFELLVENTIPDIFVRVHQKELKGTFVLFTIATDTKKHLIDVFKEFESVNGEHDFEKTKIFVKLYVHGTVHISRSQARRILTHIPERFTHVILDFDQIPTVGQAFVDEVFRVFQEAHPQIIIEYVNANEAVQFMIDRTIHRRLE